MCSHWLLLSSLHLPKTRINSNYLDRILNKSHRFTSRHQMNYWEKMTFWMDMKLEKIFRSQRIIRRFKNYRSSMRWYWKITLIVDTWVLGRIIHAIEVRRSQLGTIQSRWISKIRLIKIKIIEKVINSTIIKQRIFNKTHKNK